MLRKAKKLLDMALVATDGSIGEVEDFYFDDEAWTVRYLVVNTGSWLNKQQVLISPRAIASVDLTGNQVHVNLTKEQVQNSPDIDTHKPVSRQHEMALADYFGYPHYWRYPVLIGDPLYPASIELHQPAVTKEIAEAAIKAEEELTDPHLRSIKTVTGYHLAASDGELGHVADFLIEDETQVIRYLVIATRTWLPGEQVLVAPAWIDRLSWEEEKVFVQLSKEVISHSPVFDEAALTREYEKQLYQYYNRPAYWPDDGFE